MLGSEYVLVFATIVFVFLAIIVGVPIGPALGIVGFVGYAFMAGLDRAMPFAVITVRETVTSYTLSALLLFFLMGSFATHGGSIKRMYRLMYAWLGALPGGLAITTVGCCAAFAALCGSSVSEVSVMGNLVVGEMNRYKYSPRLSLGTLAAAGALAILIPPSGMLVIYGYITETSVGKLFAAGIIPGVIMALIFIIGIYLMVVLNPSLAPVRAEKSSLGEKLRLLPLGLEVIFIFLALMGGIMLGMFTPTEAAGIGALLTLIDWAFLGHVTWKELAGSLKETVLITATIFIIIVGAMLFKGFFVISGAQKLIEAGLTPLVVHPYAMISVLVILYLFLGTFLDGLAMLLITIPFIQPLLVAAGFDLIWFGIFFVIMVEIGLITPPLGLNVFVLKAVAKDVSLNEIFIGIVPFLCFELVVVAIIIAVPQLVLFLPSVMRW